MTFLILGLAFVPTAIAESIGVFTATSGEVQILRGQAYLGAAPGVDVEDDDIIETGKDASAQLDFEDGSVFKLGAQTRLALAEYKLDSNKNVVSAALDVLSGWVRFAVAKARFNRSYHINTPVLTIGVRGTEGTIEAENEQGGLHLTEGAVDVTPVGNDFQARQPVRVNGGEYIQRLRGQQLMKHAQPPPEFQKRLPPVMRERMMRRAQELRQRGVPPRVIRQMTREDAKRFMERHPHMRERLQQRFRPMDGNAPGAHPNQGAPASREEMLRRRQQMREERMRERGSQTTPGGPHGSPQAVGKPSPRRPLDRKQDGDSPMRGRGPQ